MTISQHTKWVTLSRAPTTSNDADGFFEALTPAGVWAWIQPTFGPANGKAADIVIETRYHRQISLETRIVYEDPVKGTTREFFVRGVQNIDERNDLLRLVCEEIQP